MFSHCLLPKQQHSCCLLSLSLLLLFVGSNTKTSWGKHHRFVIQKIQKPLLRSSTSGCKTKGVISVFVIQISTVEFLFVFNTAMDELRNFTGRSSSKRKAEDFEKKKFSGENLHTNLGELLISLWVWGQISTHLVQQIAKAAAEDLNSAFKRKINEWETLASLGSISTFKLLGIPNIFKR